MAHTFADEVIRFLTGKAGIALSSIAFSSDRSGNKEIYVMDYDGADQRRITGHRSTSMSPAWNPSGGALPEGAHRVRLGGRSFTLSATPIMRRQGSGGKS